MRDALWLNRLSHGYVYKELESGVSPQGIKNRLKKIRIMLDVNTTTEAVAKAIRTGLIQ